MELEEAHQEEALQEEALQEEALQEEALPEEALLEEVPQEEDLPEEDNHLHSKPKQHPNNLDHAMNRYEERKWKNSEETEQTPKSS